MFLFVIVAEGVDLVYDFGRIFQKVVRPYVAPDDETLDQALNHFVAYYEQSEMFDLYTHGSRTHFTVWQSENTSRDDVIKWANCFR